MLTQGLGLILISTAIGLLGAALFARTLSGLLYGVGTLDAATFVGVPLILAAAALVATLIPARRASRVDPLEAIRAE